VIMERMGTANYEVPADEALARAVEQDRFAAEVVPAASELLGPDGYGGAWIDQAGGGRLKLLIAADVSVSPEGVLAELGLGTDGRVDVVIVEHSLAELEATAAEVERRLTQGYEGAWVDQELNAVVIYSHYADADGAAAQRAAVDDLPVIFEYGKQPFSPRACINSWHMICDLPLRGGLEIADSNAGGGSQLCSSGFVTYSLLLVRLQALHAHCRTLRSVGPPHLLVQRPNKRRGVQHRSTTRETGLGGRLLAV
jgi:hypothetical protein